ncbi:hypothetical protein CO151_08375 [bacterium CG_4_9_14_3_um_filter_65_15]|nr:MAG: hypothetical protein CO151_08375 [bacterium CG_4_9_14_3_um_filter_65_15]
MTERATSSLFRSPWQEGGFVRLVGVVRTLLRLWPRLENRFIDRLVSDQNRRVHAYLRGRTPQTLLLIMPRCVKKTGCHAPVQKTLNQCLECMECPLGDVAHLCGDRGIRALVAFRSHIAFALARSEQPDLIIASACRDRMIKALRSTPEFPALLAPLTGMRKMCLDAGIDLDWIAAQLDLVLPAATPGIQDSPRIRTAQNS